MVCLCSFDQSLPTSGLSQTEAASVCPTTGPLGANMFINLVDQLMTIYWRLVNHWLMAPFSSGLYVTYVA